MNPKKILYSAIVSFLILEALSLGTMESFRPWAILSHDSLLLKIVGYFFLIQVTLALCAAAVIHATIPADKECRICNKNLRDFAPVYGTPVICRKCRTPSHEKCLLSKNKRCPVCFPESEDTEEIQFDFRSGMPSD